MSLCNCARYLTVFLVIQLTVIESQVSAFTFGRITTTDKLTDLTEAGSSRLEVRHDLSGNDVTVINVVNGATAQKIVPIETTAKTEEIQKNYPTTTEISETSTEIPASSTENEQETYETTEMNTTGTNTEGTTDIVTSDVKDKTTISETTSEDVTETYQVHNTENKTTEKESTTNQYTTLNTDGSLTKSVVRSLATIISEHMMATKTEENIPTSFFTEPAIMKETTDDVSLSTKDADSESEETFSTTLIQQSDTSTSISIETDSTTMKTELEQSTTKVEQPTESLTDGYSSDTVVPYWKKYVVINRKRLNNSVDEGSTNSTEKEDMVRADTAQSSITLDNGFNITYNNPSLEILNELISSKSNLPSTKTYLWSTTDTGNGTFTLPLTTEDSTDTIGSETVPSLGALTSENGETTKMEVLTSQRAGFLDYSAKPMTTIEAITTDSKTSSTEQNNDAEKTTDLKEVLKSTNSTSTASQSQLAEDAINEELMKEEMLSNNLAYTNQYRGERFDIKVNKNIGDAVKITTMPYQDNVQSSPESNLTDDKLSVKPITADKSKNAGLYAVNPNYKPLKKLDVQPPKPFVRDPDDNSWRNESLSSLGIVFKAKNSSKPFSQVLKNITETQLTTLLDKYNKGQELELRERLEKIAEIRKTKKKKLDGEIGLGEDEESNNSPTENISTSRTEMNVPFTFPSTNSESTTYKGVTKTLEVNTITTQKPIKQFNIESYDGNDEDDPDYITLTNIDLKKFITLESSSETPFTTSTPIFTQPLRQYLPDRQPTIQYFPPRVPQKVNINEYDDVFQRKVNAYTVKEPPKKLSQINYSTVPTFTSEYSRIEQTHIQNTARPTTESPRIIRPGVDGNHYRTKQIEFSAENQDGAFNRASYIIKHLKDFINEAANDSEEEKNSPYLLTETPLKDHRHEFAQQNGVKTNDYDDYESQFRKDVLNRFVDNFNQNSERFKSDFPVLYNTSVVHSQSAGNGKLQASSSAFLKRLYDEAKSRSSNFVQRSYDPNCDRLVELSPEYELHYYVPEQEEREEAEPKAITLPHRFRSRG